MAEHPVASDRSQRLAVIGGWLVVAGCILILVTAVVGALGQSVTIGSAGVGGLALTVALAALGAGFALLAVSGPPRDRWRQRPGRAWASSPSASVPRSSRP